MPSGAADATGTAAASLLLLHDDDDEDDDGGEAELREDEEDEAAALLLLRGLDVTGGRGMMAAVLAHDGGAGGEEQAALLRRRSVNTTECVAVPSSEHVAEIVGRQGCKIKALRAKTNTYIRTPVRGEEPVFVVTGRQEDVAAAKREILAAAEHFSVIRASRGTAAGPGGPGYTTVQVRVPYRLVGLVVGPKGATIKRIQQQTHTYIVTPSRDKEPMFQVTGMPENVDRAREEIELHIALRTGAFLQLGRDGDFRNNGTDVGFEGGPTWPGARPAMVSSYRNDSSSSLGSASTDSCLGGSHLADFSPTSPFGAGGFWIGEALPAVGAEELPLDSSTYEPLPAPSPTIWAPLEPVAAPPGLGSEPVGSARAPRRGSRPLSPRLSPTFPEGLEHPLARWAHSHSPQPGLPVCIPAFSTGTSSYSSSAGGSASSSPPERRRRHDCVLCWDGEAGAALVPCGHSLFCPPCASRLCASDAPACPVCQAAVTQAVHTHS